MRALVSKRKEYISETVKTILEKRSLNEFLLNTARAFEFGREFGGSTPDPATLDVKIYELERYILPRSGGRPPKIDPASREGKNIQTRIQMYRAAKGNVNLGRRAGAGAQNIYQRVASTVGGELGSYVDRGRDLALGKNLKSVGVESLGIGTPGGEQGEQRARIT